MELDEYVKNCLCYYDRINDRLLQSPKERILVTSLHGGRERSVIAALKAEIKEVDNSGRIDQLDGGEVAVERSRLVSQLQAKQFENASASAIREAEKITLLNARKICAEEAVKVGLKHAGRKSAVKLTGKGAVVASWKGASKFVPVAGPLLAGSCFAVYRLVNGEYAKAGAELASGVIGSIPGGGTAASLAIDAGIAGWDVYDAYCEGKSGYFDAEAHVKLAELLLRIERLIQEGVFSLEDFLDEVFNYIDAKMKASSDDVYVADYVNGIYKDFFSGELSVRASRVTEKLKEKCYKQGVLNEVYTLL